MKKTAKTMGIILFLLGLFVIFSGRAYLIPAFSKPIDIMEEGMSKIKPNKAVETDLYVVFERFSSSDGRNYHVIPVWDGDYGYYIPLCILTGSANDYAEVVDETMDYAYGYSDDYGTKTVHFQGVAVELDNATAQKMKSWFRKVGMFEQESDMDEYMLPYMLYENNLDADRRMMSIFIGITVLGLVLICIGVFVPDKIKVSLKLKETKINGVTYRMEQLKKINNLLMKGKKQEAQTILTNDFHVDSGYASFVVDNWNEYYY